MQKLEPEELLFEEQIKSSSSDAIYTVKIYHNCLSCNCPAGSKKTLCKHMIKVLQSHQKEIEEQATFLWGEITQLLVIKSQPNYSKEKLKEMASKVIFVNKEIAETGHDNAVKIKLSTRNEFTKIIDIIETKFTAEQREDILEILKNIKPHLFKTIMYLNRRNGNKIKTSYWDSETNTIFDAEEDYKAGGELVNILLKKYGADNENK